jgi:hypothetical protein
VAAPDLWVLGSPDIEMEAIEQLLLSSRQVFMRAMKNSARCSGRNAYDADPPPESDWGRIYAVECRWASMPENAISIGHHYPGDSGYGVKPADFLAGSSLGQALKVLADYPHASAFFRSVWQTDAFGAGHYKPGSFALRRKSWLLRLCGTRSDPRPTWAVVPKHLLYTAAADHCLYAAYRGECPGVDVEGLRAWHIGAKARMLQCSERSVVESIKRARTVIREAPKIHLGDGCIAADVRLCDFPDLDEAAAIEKLAYVSYDQAIDGRVKVVLRGATAGHIVGWQAWAASQGLVMLDGDPVRGVAVGYFPS